MHSNQLSPNAFTKRFDSSRIPELMTSGRHAFISMSIGFRIIFLTRIHRSSINPHTISSASPLWSAFFHHLGLALGALNQEIRRDVSYNLVNVFRSITLIAGSELFLLNSPHWRAHVNGFLSILEQNGGLSKVLEGPRVPKLIVLAFLVSCIVTNTMSSQLNQIIEVSRFDTTELYNLYTLSIFPPFLCPPHLFLDIIYINQLRLQLPTPSPAYSITSAQLTICDILKHIDAFSPQDWIESSNFPNQNEFLLVALIFQSAVALYGILTLPCKSDLHPGDACQDLELVYRTQLFQLLAVAIDSPVPTYTISWPVVVAGVAAATGSMDERALVEQHLNLGRHDPCSGSGPLKALAILRRFWASGKRSWDDCFREPNVILFSS